MFQVMYLNSKITLNLFFSRKKLYRVLLRFRSKILHHIIQKTTFHSLVKDKCDFHIMFNMI